MENTKKTPGIFILELVNASDGHSCTLWVSDAQNPATTEAFEFIGVEAKSIIEVLDRAYQWVDALGYGFDASEFIVFNLQEFGVLLGKQAEDSLWTRDFGDYVSYCAGAWGMSYADASSLLIRPITGLDGEPRYRKMAAILLLVRKQTKSFRDFLTNAAALDEVAREAQVLLGNSGLAEEIWRKSGAGEPDEKS
ncbi:hypothetical protein H7X65_03270 [Candidatus Parcubacteria bacterium]|nr:hypothetical protein [Candidatus Parcubacteria bacterium]